jgi:glutathione S-transferase
MKEVRLTKNQHLTAEYFMINPRQQVPAMTETIYEGINPNQFNLGESHTMMRYICDNYPVKDMEHLYPKDLKKRARVDEVLDWSHVGWRLCTNRLVFMRMFLKLRGFKAEATP